MFILRTSSQCTSYGWRSLRFPTSRSPSSYSTSRWNSQLLDWKAILHFSFKLLSRSIYSPTPKSSQVIVRSFHFSAVFTRDSHSSRPWALSLLIFPLSAAPSAISFQPRISSTVPSASAGSSGLHDGFLPCDVTQLTLMCWFAKWFHTLTHRPKVYFGTVSISLSLTFSSTAAPPPCCL